MADSPGKQSSRKPAPTVSSIQDPDPSNPAQQLYTRESVRRRLQMAKMQCKVQRDALLQTPKQDMKPYAGIQRSLTALRLQISANVLKNMFEKQYNKCLPFLYPRESPLNFDVVEHVMQTGLSADSPTKPIDFTTPQAVSNWTVRAGLNAETPISFNRKGFDPVNTIETVITAYTAEIEKENNRYSESPIWRNIFISNNIVPMLKALKSSVIAEPIPLVNTLFANMSDYAIRERGEEMGISDVGNRLAWSDKLNVLIPTGQQLEVTASISLVCPSYKVSDLMANKDTHQMYNDRVAPNAGATWVRILFHDMTRNVQHTLDITPFVSPQTAQVFPFTGVATGKNATNYEWDITKLDPLYVDIPTNSSQPRTHPNARFAEVDMMQLGLQTVYKFISDNKNASEAYQSMKQTAEQSQIYPDDLEKLSSLLAKNRVYYSAEDPAKGGVWAVWFMLFADLKGNNCIAGVQVRYPRTRVHMPPPTAVSMHKKWPSAPRFQQRNFAHNPGHNQHGGYARFPHPQAQAFVPNPHVIVPHPQGYYRHTQQGPGPLPGQPGMQSKASVRFSDSEEPPAASSVQVPRHISRTAKPMMAPWDAPGVDMHSLARSLEEIKRALNDAHLLKAALTC